MKVSHFAAVAFASVIASHAFGGEPEPPTPSDPRAVVGSWCRAFQDHQTNVWVRSKEFPTHCFGSEGHSECERPCSQADAVARRSILTDGSSPWANLTYQQKVAAQLEATRQQVERDAAARQVRELQREKSRVERQASIDRQVEQNKEDERVAQAETARKLAEIAAAPNPFRDEIGRRKAAAGHDLAQSPRLKADGRTYYFFGSIQKASDDATVFVMTSQSELVSMLTLTQPEIPVYVVVDVPRALQAKFAEKARVRHGIKVIGRYTGNYSLELVGGQANTTPRITAEWLAPAD